jgi:hypothetical protein
VRHWQLWRRRICVNMFLRAPSRSPYFCIFVKEGVPLVHRPEKIFPWVLIPSHKKI